jgi:excisionase family DNA binding protein
MARKRTVEIDGRPAAYRVNRAAAALDLSRSTLYLMMARGEIRFVELGGVRLIPVTEIDRLLNGGNKLEAA